MKREAYTHPKMLDLAARLGVSRPAAIGYLTLLVDWVSVNAISGDVGKWPNGAIARGCDWTGDPDEFVAALVSAGWIDEHPTHRLILHDWPEHAQSWVTSKLKRSGKSFLSCYEKPDSNQSPGQTPVPTIVPTTVPTEPDFSGPVATIVPTIVRNIVPTIVATPPCDQTKPNQTKPNPSKRVRAATGPKAEEVPIPPSLQTQTFLETWEEWILFRRKNRWPVSGDYAKTMLSKLEGYGPDVSAKAVRSSIENCYQGIFPDKFSKMPSKASSRVPGAAEYRPGFVSDL